MRKFLLIFISCVGFFAILFRVFHILTDVSDLNDHYPHVLYDPKTKTAEVQIRTKPPAGFTPLSKISPIAVSAFVLSEDWAFYQHNGFDWDQMWDSMKTNLAKGKFARGGSTITQQTVKNIYLSHEKTLWRKFQEAILVIRLERQIKKRRILELYLNIVELGEGLYGVGNASRFYFKKAPSELNAKEGAFLAMLLPSPKKYSISFRKRGLTPFARNAVDSILEKLLATHRISEQEFESYRSTPLNFENVNSLPVNPPAEEQSEEGPEE